MDPEVVQKLMRINYYGAMGATSVKKLYEKMKNRGVTMQQVKEFIDKQKTQQIFKKPKRSIIYFPIYASNGNEIFQGDLIDMSDIATANKNYCYMLACIDVFSRFAYVVPLKNKESRTVANAMEEILNIGSKFISKEFENFLKSII